jgi:predicted Rdx family selenoprotein
MRGKVEVETLLKVLLVLAVIWLALEILELFVETLQFILAALPKVIGLFLIVLIILYLLDRI